MLTKRMTLIGGGAATLVIGLIVLLAVVMGSSGTVPIVSAAGTDTPTPGPTGTPKPDGTGNLSGVYDVLVHPVGDDSVGVFHCISRTDHQPDNSMKNNAVCYDDLGFDDPDSVIPSTCPKPGPCNRGPNVLPGPNPPPPYGGIDGKGNGSYNPGTDTVSFTTCFEDLGGALGPNLIIEVTLPNAKAGLATNSTQTGTVLVYGNQGIDECNSLTPNGPVPDPLGITLYRVADLAKNVDTDGLAKSWRTAAKLPGAAIDFDGDGCNDGDELDKNRAVKPCGDDPYNPYDSDENYNSSFSLTVQVVRADACNGGQPAGSPPFFCDGQPDLTLVPGSYFNCIADIQHNKTDNSLFATSFCYTDIIITTVNSQDAGTFTCPPAPAEKCGDGLPGAGPPTLDALGDVDDPHTTLTGQYNKATNEIELEGCFQNVANILQGPKFYTRIRLDAHTLNGTADIWLNRTDCTVPTTKPSINDASVSATEQAPKTGDAADDWDTDQDGCSDKQELGNNEALGGLRDPSNPFDFYDTDNSRSVDLFGDIFGVAFAFGTPGTDKTNRGSPLTGSAGSWNLHGPDAVVDLFNDIFGVAFQFGHSCVGTSPPPPPPPPPTAAMNLTVGSGGTGSCDDTKCDVPLNGNFTLDVEVTKAPAGGYIGIQTEVDVDGLTYTQKARITNEIVWPDANGLFVRSAAGSVVNHGAATGSTVFPISTFGGTIVRLNLTCTGGKTNQTIDLVPRNPVNTDGSGFKLTATTEATVAPDSLQINCVNATVCPPGEPPPLTPPGGTPTPTPCPATLAVEGVQQLSGGKASALAGERLRWICDPNDAQAQVTLRFQYTWGTEDIPGKGLTVISHNPPVQLQTVECLVNTVSIGTISVNWVLIDPSGVVFDAISSVPVSGATVSLEYNDGGTWRALDAADSGDQLLMDPDINPQTTGLTGHYGWDVAPGEYRVQVSKSGCTSNTGGPVTIPPAVTDLDVGIVCGDADGDGLPDIFETSDAGGTGTDPNNPDTDGDGTSDADEDCDNDGLTNIVELGLGTDPCGPDDIDSDLDGCTNIEEFGSNGQLGGLRDSSNFWDFYDTPDAANVRDQAVDLFNDIFAVSLRFGASDSGAGDFDRTSNPLVGPPNALVEPSNARENYHPAFDRGPPTNASGIISGPADGNIDLFNDIFGVAFQFGHTCAALP